MVRVCIDVKPSKAFKIFEQISLDHPSLKDRMHIEGGY